MSGVLIGARAVHSGEAVLKVFAEGEQLPLGARVVGEVPDVPAPRWWGLYKAHLKQQRDRPPLAPRWETPTVRDTRDQARLDRAAMFWSGRRVGDPVHRIWEF